MSKFFKDNKIGQARRGGVQFVVFKKFSSAYYTKLLAITTALNKCSDHQINWEQTDFGTK